MSMDLYLNSTSRMSNRNFGYYGNNRLQKQTNARNLYLNNIHGKKIINNPQNSNGNASQVELYHEGAQTTYNNGVAVSVGGIFGIPQTSRVIPCPSITLEDIAIFNTDYQVWYLKSNTTILACQTLTIPNTTLIVGNTFINNGTINNNGLIQSDGTITNNGTFNNTTIVFNTTGIFNNNNIFYNIGVNSLLSSEDGPCYNNGTIYNNGRINNINSFSTNTFINNGSIYNTGILVNNYINEIDTIFTNNNIIYNSGTIDNNSIFENVGEIWNGIELECGKGIIIGTISGTILDKCPV